MKNRQVVGGTPVVDTALDTQSEDVVQNKVVAEAISTINSNLGQKSEASAVSGDTAFAKINSLNNSLTKSIKFVTRTGTNASIVSINFTVSNDGGVYLYCNANQEILALINCNITNPSQNKIVTIYNSQSHNLSLSVSGKIFTITSNKTLWGENVVMGSNLA